MSLITREQSELRRFLKAQEKIVLKPLDGMGGRAIFVVALGDANTNVILETLTDNGTRYILAQQFIPDISDGDTRIILIDGKPID